MSDDAPVMNDVSEAVYNDSMFDIGSIIFLGNGIKASRDISGYISLLNEALSITSINTPHINVIRDSPLKNRMYVSRMSDIMRSVYDNVINVIEDRILPGSSDDESLIYLYSYSRIMIINPSATII